MSFLPSQKSLRILTHHHRHRQTPHHHTYHHKHPRLHTYTYVTDPRSPTSLPHSPEHITVTPHVHDHSYASLSHPPSKQTDAITKVNSWMNDCSVCSDSSSGNCSKRASANDVRQGRSSFTYTAASTRYCLTNSFSRPFEHIHASSIFMPSSKPSSSKKTTTKHTRAEIKIKLRRQFPGVRYALTFLKRGGLALVLETPKEINTILKQTKWDEDFFGKDLYIHLANKDARPWLCVNKVPPTMELAKIKEGISRIDPVVGMENWKIRIEACIGSLRDPTRPSWSSSKFRTIW